LQWPHPAAPVDDRGTHFTVQALPLIGRSGSIDPPRGTRTARLLVSFGADHACR
jgi:hypothetical protein